MTIVIDTTITNNEASIPTARSGLILRLSLEGMLRRYRDNELRSERSQVYASISNARFCFPRKAEPKKVSVLRILPNAGVTYDLSELSHRLSIVSLKWKDAQKDNCCTQINLVHTEVSLLNAESLSPSNLTIKSILGSLHSHDKLAYQDGSGVSIPRNIGLRNLFNWSFAIISRLPFPDHLTSGRILKQDFSSLRNIIFYLDRKSSSWSGNQYLANVVRKFRFYLGRFYQFPSRSFSYLYATLDGRVGPHRQCLEYKDFSGYRSSFDRGKLSGRLYWQFCPPPRAIYRRFRNFSPNHAQ